MQFKTTVPQPPKEVTVTFPFDEFIAIMRLIGNSNSFTAVDELDWVTNKEYRLLESIFNDFSFSNISLFYRGRND